MTAPIPMPAPMHSHAAPRDTVAVPLSRLAELARRVERAGADRRLCDADGYKAPGYSAARVRDALVGVLGMLTGQSNTVLYELLRAGRLVEQFGGTVRERLGTCHICRRQHDLIDAKHNPRELDTYAICRAETDCLPPA